MRAQPDQRQRTREHLERFLDGDERARLRATVADICGAPLWVIDDALQDVSQLAAAGRCDGTTDGQVFQWLVTATLRRVGKLLDRAHVRREMLVDWRQLEEDDPRGPADPAEVEVLAQERERELTEVARRVVAALDERQQRVVALHAHRLPRREIAERLGISERQAKRLKEATFEHARHVLVEAAGGGCAEGERLVGRLSFGLASPSERNSARLHLAGCTRCAALYQRLELVHEKVAALLPVPAVAHAKPALVEQALHNAAHAVASAKQQLAGFAGQAKQHAAAGYGRAAEYSALATARPGAAATAIAGCLALGGGAAGYCINQNVNPLNTFAAVIPHTHATPPSHRAHARTQPKPAPTVPADPVAQAPQTTPTQTRPAAQTQPSQQQSQAAPAKATPAAVQFGEPSSPPAGSSSSQPSSGGTSQASAQPSKPAEAPAGGFDVYGP